MDLTSTCWLNFGTFQNCTVFTFVMMWPSTLVTARVCINIPGQPKKSLCSRSARHLTSLTIHFSTGASVKRISQNIRSNVVFLLDLHHSISFQLHIFKYTLWPNVCGQLSIVSISFSSPKLPQSWKHTMSLYSVALQFPFTGTKRVKPVRAWQCNRAQSQLQEVMVCQV